jgi:hypothetical protein
MLALASHAAIAFLGQSCDTDADCVGPPNTTETGGLEKCLGAADDDAEPEWSGTCGCYWSWGTKDNGCYTPGRNFGWYIAVHILRSVMFLFLAVRCGTSIYKLQRQMGSSVATFCSSTLQPVLLIFLGSIIGTLQAIWYPLIIAGNPDMGYRDARRVHYFLLGASAMLGLASILLTALLWLDIALTSKSAAHAPSPPPAGAR